jgi:hypothetical protein
VQRRRLVCRWHQFRWAQRAVEIIVPTIEGITFSLPHACSQTEASGECGCWGALLHWCLQRDRAFPGWGARQAKKHQMDAGGPRFVSPISTHVLCCTRTHASLFSFTIARATHYDSHRSAVPCLLQEQALRASLRLCTQSCSGTRISTLITGHAGRLAPATAACLSCSTAGFDR